MSLVAWIVLGALAGLLFAGVFFQKRLAYWYFGGLALGAFGGLVGGFVFQYAIARGPVQAVQFSPWSLLGALLGSVMILYGFQVLRRTGHGT